MLDNLDKAIGNLASFPASGRVLRDNRLGKLGYHMLVVEMYLVFYKITGDAVVIHRVLHGKRRYSFLI